VSTAFLAGKNGSCKNNKKLKSIYCCEAIDSGKQQFAKIAILMECRMGERKKVLHLSRKQSEEKKGHLVTLFLSPQK
jgi:hypothetical protein